MIVTFLFSFVPPLIPQGNTFAPLLTAKKATPSFTFSPFSNPFLVPSGNSAIHFPSFKSFSDVLIAEISFSSLFTGIASNTHPKNAKNLFLYNSSLAKNYISRLAVTTINGGSK